MASIFWSGESRQSGSDSGLPPPHWQQLTATSNILAARETSAPIDLRGVARDLGIEVIELPLPELVACRVRPKTSFPDERFVIEINGKDSAWRRRFSLAHAIGHVLLHGSQIHDVLEDLDDYKSKLGETQEKEASRLAINLLVPRPLLIRLNGELEGDVAALAKRFDVTEAIIAFRLEELGLRAAA